MHFIFILVSVKHSSMMESNNYYKHDAYKIEARNETEYQTPRIDLIRALGHVDVLFKFV